MQPVLNLNDERHVYNMLKYKITNTNMQEILTKTIIGKRFKLLRTEKGISQQEASDLFQMSRSNYSQIELGKQFPTFETLINVARYYGKCYEWLRHGNDGFASNTINTKINLLVAELARQVQIVDETTKKIREEVKQLKLANNAIEI